MSLKQADRNAEFYRRTVLEGHSAAEVAREHGVTGARVRQIVHHVGREKFGKSARTLDELRKLEQGAADTTPAKA